MPERLGLFGGSFDPVHRAHVALAQQALHTLQLDRVLWIPAGQPWQKARPMTAAQHREAMLRLALQGEPRYEIDRRELLQHVTLAVASRPGAAAAPAPEVQRHGHVPLPMTEQDIAATDIRARVAAGQGIDHLVPPEVARYIDSHGLYGPSSGS